MNRTGWLRSKPATTIAWQRRSRAAERERRAALRAASATVRARSRGRCEAQVSPDCSFRARHVHHRKPRSLGGTNDVANLIHVCRECHRYAHDHPEFAGGLGLLLGAWQDPEEVA